MTWLEIDLSDRVSLWTPHGLDADGRYHCEEGPAVTSRQGLRLWYRHGLLHRLSGPAVVLPPAARRMPHDFEVRVGPDGTAEGWYVRGVSLTDKLPVMIAELDLPPTAQWTPVEWTWFRLWASAFA